MSIDVTTEKGLLYSIRKLAANFGKARKYEMIDLSDGLVHTLTVPINCQYAEMRLSTTSPSANTPVARFLNDGETPSSTIGIPLLGWEMLDRSDYENLKNFKIIGFTGTEKLYVQYYNIQY